jgi:hypothetical protein
MSSKQSVLLGLIVLLQKIYPILEKIQVGVLHFLPISTQDQIEYDPG